MFLAEQKRRFFNLLRPFFLTVAVLYFSYHIVSGDKGVLAMIKLSQQVESARKDSDNIKAKKMILKHRVNMMRSGSLDSDLLDEQVRSLLGYAGNSETVYLDSK